MNGRPPHLAERRVEERLGPTLRRVSDREATRRPALETALDELAVGDSAHSVILDRISRRRNRSLIAPSMPPLANEEVNTELVGVLTRWIDRL